MGAAGMFVSAARTDASFGLWKATAGRAARPHGMVVQVA